MKKRKEIIKYTKAIQISNTVGLVAHKCFNILYNEFFSDAWDEIKKNQTSMWDMIKGNDYPYYSAQEIKESGIVKMKDINIKTMPVNYLMEKLGMKHHDYEYLHKTLKELVNAKIEFNILDNDGKNSWGYYNILSAVDVSSGEVRYEIPTMLIDRLIKSKLFTTLNLSIQNKITNRYALILYENCMHWYDESKPASYSPKLSIDQVRKLLLGDTKKYNSAKEFNRLLKNIIKHLNKVSDLDIRTRTWREKRKIKFLQFSIRKSITKEVGTKTKREISKGPKKGLEQLRESVKEKGIINA